MSFAPSAASPSASPSQKGLEIITIPDQFYGVALKLNGMTSAERAAAAIASPAPVAPAPIPAPVAVALPTKAALIRPPETHRSPWPMIGVVAGVLVLSAGGFVYFNRNILFHPAVVVQAPPKPVAPPLPPSALTAVASQSAISLAWTDAATNEQGYYLERHDGSQAAFTRITTLPAKSTAFIDVTVTPGSTYAYRLIATGAGGDSAPSNEATASVQAPPPPEPPKPTFPPGGLDTDSDGLTDVEEALYGTDPQKPDTDGDHFLDGNEVFHLYNPATSAPGKLIESGLVRSLTASSGWKMYIPTKWTDSVDPTDVSKTLIQTGHGEQFTITVESNPSKQDLATWVGARINQPATSLGEFTSKGGLRGVYSPDRMQAWIEWGDAVFHIDYNLRDQPFVNFRTTFEMMLNSLVLDGAAIFPTTMTPANSGPGSLLNVPTTSTEVLVASSTVAAVAATSTLPVVTSTTSTTVNTLASSTSTTAAPTSNTSSSTP